MLKSRPPAAFLLPSIPITSKLLTREIEGTRSNLNFYNHIIGRDTSHGGEVFLTSYINPSYLRAKGRR